MIRAAGLILTAVTLATPAAPAQALTQTQINFEFRATDLANCLDRYQTPDMQQAVSSCRELIVLYVEAAFLNGLTADQIRANLRTAIQSTPTNY